MPKQIWPGLSMFLGALVLSWGPFSDWNAFGADRVDFQTESDSGTEALVGDFIRMERGSIRGTVRFEKRRTRVVEEVCVNEPCIKSEPYWSVAILVGKTKYVVNQMLEAGSHLPPDFLEMAGVVLRPGSIVQVEGMLMKGGSDLYWVVGLERIAVVMDQ